MSRWRVVHGLALLVSGLIILVELWRLVGLWSAALALHVALWVGTWAKARASAPGRGGGQKQQPPQKQMQPRLPAQ